MGASPRVGDRRHGCGWIEHPPRCPPAPGDARASAHQRGRQRGVDSRQDAPPCRRAGPQPARPAVGAREGKLREASWTEALDIFARRLKKAGGKVAAIAGDLLDAETMYAAKKLLEGQGSKLLEGRQTGLNYDCTSLSAVAFNSTIAGIETCRRGAARRIEHPLGSAADRHARAQGLAQGRQGLRDRARGRSRHEGRLARRRSRPAREAAEGSGRSLR